MWAEAYVIQWTENHVYQVSATAQSFWLLSNYLFTKLTGPQKIKGDVFNRWLHCAYEALRFILKYVDTSLYKTSVSKSKFALTESILAFYSLRKTN